MKPKHKFHNRFHKIANAIIQKNSPSFNEDLKKPVKKEALPLTDADDDAMGITEEEEAVDQEGKRAKRKPKDYNSNNLF